MTRPGLRRHLALLLGGALLAGGLVTVAAQPAAAAYPVPPTPSGLPSAIEAIQPYIGQSICDPVAKPGVVAFKNLLIRTYPDTGSLGIIRSCGTGGQSEHKEGRAFDWKVSYYNARQRAEANTVIAWLTKTDGWGHKAAMARRLGIMYMIWNNQIWKAYDPRGWQPYHGASTHRDHVHFSFGWNGAKKVTSYWDKTVAPIDFGPNPPAHVTPVRKVSNIALVRQYGGTTLALPTTSYAVKLVQSAMKLPVDGDYGSDTAAAVARFQVDQHLEPTQVFRRAEWKALFPAPVIPFGGVDTTRSALGDLLISGWAIDADTTAPINVTATLDGVSLGTTAAALLRDDVAKAYPEWGGGHGFAFTVPLPITDTAAHTLCITAINATGTPGTNGSLGCRSVTLQHTPVGALETAQQSLGLVHVTGWALDPDVADLVTTALTVDGVPSAVVPTAVTRTDIATRWPGEGDQHGVEADLALPEGTHTVCLSAANVIGTLGSDAQLGCRSVVVRHSPVGTVEVLRRAPGGVQVGGWALDPDVTDAVTTQVLSDGALVTSLSAFGARSSLPSTWTANGTDHGFSTVVDLPAGTHSVCVRVRNAALTAGTDVTLPCRTVTVSHDAAGVVTALRTEPAVGRVLLSGDAYDADTTAPISVVPVVDGVARTAVTAGLTSATASTRWPGYGSSHAFLTRLTLTPGTHSVCLRAVNATGTVGTDRVLACRSLVVSNAVGSRSVRATTLHRVVANGWAIDPDTRSAAYVTVTVDGRVRWYGAASRLSSVSAYPGYGSYHGFWTAITTTRGTHRVCVYARNVSGTPGLGRALGCSSVTVS